MTLQGGLIVRGHKKGAGSTGGPTEATDTLRSTQMAEVVDLISEGPVQGLVNGLKSVYLDGVPLVSSTGDENFDGVTFTGTVGTQGQAALHGFELIQEETAVGVKVLHDTPVVRTITDPDVDTARVTIGVPQLSFQDPSTGNLGGNHIEYKIELQSNGGGYVSVYHTFLDGKTMSRYLRSTVVPLTGSAPWDIRVTRISPDTTTSNDVADLWWDSFTEIITAKLRYPNSALVGLRVNARNFQRVPTRAYDVMLRVVQVPSNYNPLTRVYTGTWDGTFVPAWTNNPAWVFYDLVLHPRYGLGQYVQAAHLNKWRLYQIAQYCDQLVPDGRGGTEPRFTCNCYLQTQTEAYKLLQDLVGIFRGILFYASGTVDVVQDAPGDAVSLFTPANVIDGRFVYQGTSERTRHSGVIVYWNNLRTLGRREPELFQDPVLVARYGVRNLELSPLGTWSRGEAVRLAKWALYSEEYESEIVSFTVGSEGALVPIGRVFKIADPSVAGLRLGGRVKTSTTTTVTLDREVTLSVGAAYTLSVSMPDGSDPFHLQAQARTVSTGAGTTAVLAVTSAFSAAPPAGSVWLLESTELVATTWRCLSIKPIAGQNQFEITGVAHNASKYALIELGIQLEGKPVSVIRDQAITPTDLVVTESVYTSGAATKSRLTVSWTPGAAGQNYRVTWRYQGGVWVTMPDTPAQTVDLVDIEPGDIDLAVRAVNALGNVSRPLTGTYTVTGKVTGPAAPTSVTAVGIVRGIRVSWVNPVDNDLREIEIWMGTTNVLASAGKIAAIAGTAYDKQGLFQTDGARYFWVRAVDNKGQFSAFVGPVTAAADVVVSADLDAGSVALANFAADLEPVRIVTSVPGTLVTRAIYNVTDGNLYRWQGSSYVRTIPTADLTGYITAGQMAANSITAGNLAVAAAAIDTLQLAGSSVTVPVVQSTTSDTTLSTAGVTYDLCSVSVNYGAIPPANVIVTAVAAFKPASGSPATFEDVELVLVRTVGGSPSEVITVTASLYGNLHMVLPIQFMDTSSLSPNTIYTYSVRARRSGGPTSISPVCDGASIVALGAKR